MFIRPSLSLFRGKSSQLRNSILHSATKPAPQLVVGNSLRYSSTSEGGIISNKFETTKLMIDWQIDSYNDCLECLTSKTFSKKESKLPGVTFYLMSNAEFDQLFICSLLRMPKTIEMNSSKNGKNADDQREKNIYNPEWYEDPIEGPDRGVLAEYEIFAREEGKENEERIGGGLNFFGASTSHLLEKINPNKVETLSVEIRHTRPFNVPSAQTVLMVKNGWAAKFSLLYGDEASSDCSFQVGDALIKAHRSILMAQSPFFNDYFHGGQLQTEGAHTMTPISITDFDVDTFRRFLYFCYHCSLPATREEEFWFGEDGGSQCEEIEEKLLKLANAYGVAELKSLMEGRLIKSIKVGNVVEKAVLADVVSAPELSMACARLIANNTTTVFASAAWRTLISTRPEIANRILTNIVLLKKS